MIQNEDKGLDKLRNVYRSIKQFMEDKDYLKANKCINEGVDIVKNNPENMFFSSIYKYQCKIHVIKNEYSEAIINAEIFLKNKEKSSIVDLDFYIIIGNAYEKLEDYDNALKAYNNYLNAYKQYKEGNLERNISIVDNVDYITVNQYNFILLTVANCAFKKDNDKNINFYLKDVNFELIGIENLSHFVMEVFSYGQNKENFDFVYKLYEKFYNLEWPNYFYALINLGEEKLRENPKAMLKYTESFKDSDLNNEYVRLQKLRYLDISGEENKALEIYERFMKDMEILVYPYNDLLYYGIKYHKDLDTFYDHMEFNSIDVACMDIGLKHEEFCKTLLKYLEKSKDKSIGIKTAFMLSILLESGLSIAKAEKDVIETMFDYFTKTTAICIDQIFQKSILNDENCFLLPKGYRFAYYMGKAFREKDKKEIFEDYLFKAKECYPAMEKAIKLLG